MFKHRLLYTLLSIPVFNVSVFADDTRLFRSEPISLPGKVTALTLSKDKGILWVGTTTGLCKVHDIDEPNESERTCKDFGSVGEVSALETDFEGGVWISTRTGLQYINAEGNDIIVPPLPNGESKVNVMLTDKTGELLIGIPETLLYPPWNMSAFQPTVIPTSETPAQFSIFSSCLADLTESYFPYETNTVILDDNGDLWIGTQNRGLFHCAQGENKVVQFNTANTQQKLATDSVSAIAPDGRGGLWIGLTSGFELDFLSNGGGLVHRFANGTWATFNTSNSELPDNKINVLSNDQQGGVWIGTSKGLAHLDALEKWTLTEDEPKLPNTEITALAANQSYSVWVGTNEELVHLSISSPRAAIIIAGGGNHSLNTFWNITENITKEIYISLTGLGFLDDEIYYLSPEAAASGFVDGQTRHIIDAPYPSRPLEIEDITKAFKWAQSRGKLEQPLYIFMIGHGRRETGEQATKKASFELSGKGDAKIKLSSDDLNTYLNDYQNDTDSEVILLIEACYSGNFLEPLKRDVLPRRAIITSASDEEAQFDVDRKEGIGFSHFFIKRMSSGFSSFFEMFTEARKSQERLIAGINEKRGGAYVQFPQLDDNGDGLFIENSEDEKYNDGTWLKKVVIKGNSPSDETDTPDKSYQSVLNLTDYDTVNVGQHLPLQAQLNYPDTEVKRVWVELQPINPTESDLGVSQQIELSYQTETNLWETDWQVTNSGGKYHLVIYVQNKTGEPFSVSSPIEILDFPTLGGTVVNKSALMTTTFSGGISVNEGHDFQSELTVNLVDNVDVRGALLVDETHVNELVDIVVYASLDDEAFFMLSGETGVLSWDEDPASLAPFMRSVTLIPEYTITLYKGHFILPGQLRVFFGYRLANGTLVQNKQPIDITIVK